jgi:Domain of unknown function (DUF4350)
MNSGLRPVAPVVALVALLTAFLAGIIWLLAARLGKGDTYPPLSTLRSDPLGAKVLYESLADLQGFAVSRNYRTFENLHPEGATVFFLDMWPAQASSAELDTLATDGGRVVIAFRPLAEVPKREDAKGKVTTVSTFENAKRIGVDFAFCEQSDARFARGRPRTTVLYFSHPEAVWRTLDQGPCGPTEIERPFGRGSLVLVANPFPFSNEAMAGKPDTRFLMRMLGSNRRAIFDESHFGIEETPGVALLARQYHLQWAVAALLVLVVLFIWRQSALFPPAAGASEDDAEVEGRETSDGLGRLLRRGIPPRDVVGACVAEWRKSRGARHVSAPRLGETAETALEIARSPDAVRAYREIASLLNRT